MTAFPCPTCGTVIGGARVLSAPRPLPVIDAIVEAAASALGVPATRVRMRDRSRSVSRARALAMLLARETLGMSFADLGAAFGQADHTSAMTAVRTMRERMVRDEGLRGAYAAARSRVCGRGGSGIEKGDFATMELEDVPALRQTVDADKTRTGRVGARPVHFDRPL